MLKTFIIYIFIMLSVSTGFIRSCQADANLAMGKPYSLSPKPNYQYSAPSGDITSLTDGRHTFGYFWTQKTTVGWSGVKIVEILIDLENESNISAINFSTARGIHAGVSYPSPIHAYVGRDKNHLAYVGDVSATRSNTAGAYETKRFLLENLNIKGRYVLLEVHARGDYIFCDEIEVLAGHKTDKNDGDLTIAAARSHSNQMKTLADEKEFLNGLVDKFTPAENKTPSLKERLSIIKEQNPATPAGNGLETVEINFFKLRAESLRAQFPGKKLLIEAVNPWGSLSPVTAPSGRPLSGLSLAMPLMGYDSASFTITNLSNYPIQLDLSVNNMTGVALALIIYHVPFVKSATMEYVADPLVQIKDGITLKAGETRMVFLTAQGKITGKGQCLLNITSGGTAHSIPLEYNVLKVALPMDPVFNSVNWSYLDFKPVRDRKSEAVKDLFAHHTNVIVIPPAYLPITFSDSPDAFNKLDTYLAYHKGASKFLLFMEYRNTKRATFGEAHQFMDDMWKESFKRWYAGVQKSFAKAGYRESSIYLYPFDEMSEKESEQFIALVKWASNEIPGIKFYATLDKKESLHVLPYVDIAQIIDRENILEHVNNPKGALWLYDAKGTAKSLSAYTYYRLMPWKAFVRGFQGAGFWAYADTGFGDNPGSAWNDFDGKNPDYAVIYDGNGTSIVSSRRWEAWRMGIEDYELLTLYAKQKGMVEAKKLAKSVLDSPSDMSKADAVRRKILIELSR